MTTVVVAEGEALDEKLSPINSEPEVTTEVIEQVTDSAVEVAQIEAARDIAIAEIQADVAQATIEAAQEQQESEQLLRERLTFLEGENSQLLERVTSLEAQLMVEEIQETVTNSEPSASEVILAEAETLTPTEPDLTPTSTADEISSTLTEAIVKSEGGNLEVGNVPPLLTVPVKPRPIIRLV